MRGREVGKIKKNIDTFLFVSRPHVLPDSKMWFYFTRGSFSSLFKALSLYIYLDRYRYLDIDRYLYKYV